ARLRSEIETTGADEAEIEECGGRARPTVEDECQRPVRAAVLGDVGDVEDRGDVVARRVVEGQSAGGGGVGEWAAGGVERVLGDRIAGQQPQQALARG